MALKLKLSISDKIKTIQDVFGSSYYIISSFDMNSSEISDVIISCFLYIFVLLMVLYIMLNK